jgi:hypothetical protein
VLELAFFRSAEYRTLIAALDASGGFFVKRWGDGPVRTLALGFLANTTQVRAFSFLFSFFFFLSGFLSRGRWARSRFGARLPRQDHAGERFYFLSFVVSVLTCGLVPV